MVAIRGEQHRALESALRAAKAASSGDEAFIQATVALNIFASEPSLREPQSVKRLIALLEQLHRGRSIDLIGAALKRARGWL